ncbi:hypothetical protein L202_03093 [Cryptococcus amylolentus CBS 6039]|uniref:Zn(2)-C6 fungal-type domain-containing protein n=1 Tax=Cryptococcus amylolentus CBS 6039 TaxID=1295533 RepID=A0A1E3HXF0_9TREE|nr:hypothetical protein L202_03093 [Cryptococcus amylolentus CBS 6039]ODN80984.1 hypothetical protein L202_03093 [Cryptococcus amylolentus CBS 6039]
MSSFFHLFTSSRLSRPMPDQAAPVRTDSHSPPPKRLRTSKACANCKTRKIRCEFNDDAGPDAPCKRCKTYGLVCEITSGRDRDRDRGRTVQGGQGGSVNAASQGGQPRVDGEGVGGRASMSGSVSGGGPWTPRTVQEDHSLNARRPSTSAPHPPNNLRPPLAAPPMPLSMPRPDHSPLTRPSPHSSNLDTPGTATHRLDFEAPRDLEEGTPPPPTTQFTVVSAPSVGASPAQSTLNQLAGLPMKCGMRQLLENKVEGSHFCKAEPRMLGSTSLSSLIAPITHDNVGSSRVFVHDMRYGIRRRTTLQEEAMICWSLNGSTPIWRLPSDPLQRPMMEKLLATYADTIAPIFPVLLPQEVRNMRALSAFQILSMCSLASLSRTVPEAVCQSFRSRLYHLLEGAPGGNIWTASQANLSSLLVISLSAELHGITESTGGGICWLRVGVAIRMAQDLGLHRHVTDFGMSSLQQQTRTRIWSLCIMLDAWYALSHGQPLMIDTRFCDAKKPSVPDADDTSQTAYIDRYVYHTWELTQLLRRTLVCLFDISKGPLASVDRTELEAISEDLVNWRGKLSAELLLTTSSGPQDSCAALLELMAVCIQYVAWRPFRFPSSTRDTSTFNVTTQQWDALVQRSLDVAKWTVLNGTHLIDTCFIATYSLAHIAQMHFYHYLSTTSPKSLQALASITEAFETWASTQGDRLEATSLRYRVYDLVNQLNQAAAEGCVNPRASAADVWGILDPLFLAPRGAGSSGNMTDVGNLSADQMFGAGDAGGQHADPADLQLPESSGGEMQDWNTLMNMMGLTNTGWNNN